MAKSIILFLALLLASVCGQTICHTNSDCTAGSCCAGPPDSLGNQYCATIPASCQCHLNSQCSPGQCCAGPPDISGNQWCHSVPASCVPDPPIAIPCHLNSECPPRECCAGPPDINGHQWCHTLPADCIPDPPMPWPWAVACTAFTQFLAAAPLGGRGELLCTQNSYLDPDAPVCKRCVNDAGDGTDDTCAFVEAPCPIENIEVVWDCSSVPQSKCQPTTTIMPFERNGFCSQWCGEDASSASSAASATNHSAGQCQLDGSTCVQ